MTKDPWIDLTEVMEPSMFKLGTRITPHFIQQTLLSPIIAYPQSRTNFWAVPIFQPISTTKF